MSRQSNMTKEKKNNFYKIFAVICIVLGILFLIISVSYKIKLYTVGILFMILAVFLLLMATNHNKEIERGRIKNITLPDMTQHYLTRLSSSVYKLKSNITISGGSDVMKFFCIAVGLNGVFYVESCKANGKITGDIKDKDFTLEDESGDKKQIPNPMFELDKRTKLLSDKIKKTGIKIDIVPVLFFSGYNCQAEIQNDTDCLIVSNLHLHGEELIGAISKYNSGKEVIKDFQKEKILSALLLN